MNHEYRGDELIITWDDEVCEHAAVCVRTLPAVFDTSRKPWVDPSAAPVDDAIAAVRACPSGALQFRRPEG